MDARQLLLGVRGGVLRNLCGQNDSHYIELAMVVRRPRFGTKLTNDITRLDAVVARPLRRCATRLSFTAALWTGAAMLSRGCAWSLRTSRPEASPAPTATRRCRTGPAYEVSSDGAASGVIPLVVGPCEMSNNGSAGDILEDVPVGCYSGEVLNNGSMRTDLSLLQASRPRASPPPARQTSWPPATRQRRPRLYGWDKSLGHRSAHVARRLRDVLRLRAQQQSRQVPQPWHACLRR